MSNQPREISQEEAKELFKRIGKSSPDRENTAFKALCDYADYLIESDELEKAEWLLNHGMPGYYRDNPPESVKKLKQELYRFLMNHEDYANAPDDHKLVDPERAKFQIENLMRGLLVMNDVKQFNINGVIPHIYEMGPGEFWLPIGLKEHGCKFTYHASFISGKAYELAKKHLGDFIVDKPTGQPEIYVACEIIEHLRHEFDIVHTMTRAGINPEKVHLSTPKYTFGDLFKMCGHQNWRDSVGLGGHLRTYTPTEFWGVAQKMFPQYNFQYYDGQVLSAVGTKKGV